MPELYTDLISVYVFRRPTSAALAAQASFLLLRRAPNVPLPGTWQTIYGKRRGEESAVQAARRELAEETQLSPLRFWQLEHVAQFYLAERDRIVLCPQFVAQVAPDAEPTRNHEHDQHRWLALSEARSAYHWPSQRRAIDEIAAEILAPSAAEPTLRLD